MPLHTETKTVFIVGRTIANVSLRTKALDAANYRDIEVGQRLYFHLEDLNYMSPAVEMEGAFLCGKIKSIDEKGPRAIVVVDNVFPVSLKRVREDQVLELLSMDAIELSDMVQHEVQPDGHNSVRKPAILIEDAWQMMNDPRSKLANRHTRAYFLGLMKEYYPNLIEHSSDRAAKIISACAIVAVRNIK